MKDYQKDFLQFALDCGVLRFGEFTLKSGRNSPYFFNAGLFNTGSQLTRLGEYYAATIVDSKLQFDILYGPAYKGIPLVSAAAIALANTHDIDIPYCFNRKEVKDHGEGGTVVGAKVKGRVAIIDDVISAGTSVRESFDIISKYDAAISAIFIALDRQERGIDSNYSAVEEVKRKLQVQVHAIANLQTLLEFLQQDVKYKQHLSSVESYRDKYGV